MLIASIVLTGCGGDDAPERAAEKPAATPDGCAEAEKKVAALKAPRNLDQMIDYAAAAADAMPATRPSRAALMDIELPASERDMEGLEAKLATLEQGATDDCGEREAAETLRAAFEKEKRGR